MEDSNQDQKSTWRASRLIFYSKIYYSVLLLTRMPIMNHTIPPQKKTKEMTYCLLPRHPKSSKYLVNRCLEPLRAEPQEMLMVSNTDPHVR